MRRYYKVYGKMLVPTNQRGDIKYVPSALSFKELMTKFNSHNVS